MRAQFPGGGGAPACGQQAGRAPSTAGQSRGFLTSVPAATWRVLECQSATESTQNQPSAGICNHASIFPLVFARRANTDTSACLSRRLSDGDPKRAPGAEFCALLLDALGFVHACRACCSCHVQKSGPMSVTEPALPVRCGCMLSSHIRELVHDITSIPHVN